VNRIVLVFLISVAASPGRADAAPLSEFELLLQIQLPDTPSGSTDFSGVAYNHDTGTLFIVDNANEDVFEFTVDGTLLRVITGIGFEDTEGIFYLGGDQFAISEEKRSVLNVVTIDAATTTIDRSQATLVQPTLGDKLEGVAYDQVGGVFYAVNERSPMEVYRIEWDGTATLEAAVTTTAAALVTDLAGIHVVGGNDPRLYLLSQESATLLEVDLLGQVHGSLSLPGTDLEGVSLSPAGSDLYVVGEPRDYLHLRAPDPVPAISSGGVAILALLLAGSGCLLRRTAGARQGRRSTTRVAAG
jgi:uncharacterized protein YjiK